LNRADLSAGVAPVDLLVQTGLADSKTRARETVLSGAFSVNHRRIDRPDQLVTAAQLIGGSFMVLRRGKKTYHLINVQD
jgi:tyrosyl-tRNA synthetase